MSFHSKCTLPAGQRLAPALRETDIMPLGAEPVARESQGVRRLVPYAVANYPERGPVGFPLA
jgi:hypothetical protein